MRIANLRGLLQHMKSVDFNELSASLNICGFKEVNDSSVLIDQVTRVQGVGNDQSAQAVELDLGSPHQIPHVGMASESEDLLV